jgi:glutathione S-transferase
MTDLTLVIGNKNYSSWSLRPWLLLKQAGIPFVERYLPIRSAAWNTQIRELSPSGKVPALLHGDVRIWDSLAICEYLAERFPEKQLWPAAVAARAEARSVSAEMHSGF